MLRCSEAAVQLILFQNSLVLIVKALAFKWGLESDQRKRQVRGCSPFQSRGMVGYSRISASSCFSSSGINCAITVTAWEMLPIFHIAITGIEIEIWVWPSLAATYFLSTRSSWSWPLDLVLHVGLGSQRLKFNLPPLETSQTSFRSDLLKGLKVKPYSQVFNLWLSVVRG